MIRAAMTTVGGLSAALLALVVLTGGCTHTFQKKIAPFTAYPEAEAIAVPVQLTLTPEFASYTYKRSAMGDTWVLPIGPALAENAETLARRAFRDVRVARGPSGPAADGLPTLTPRVATVERTLGTFAGSEISTLVSVEWTFADSAGDPVWVRTVDGLGKCKVGHLWTPDSQLETDVQDAIHAAYRKSFEEIMIASEIRGYAPIR